MLGNSLASAREVLFGEAATDRVADVVLQHGVAEVELEGSAPRLLEDVLDLVPPEPERAVEKTCRHKGRDRAIELSEQRRGNLCLLHISIVDRKRDRVTDGRQFSTEAGEQTVEADEPVLRFPEVRQQLAHRFRIVATHSATGVDKAMQHEHDGGPALQWPKKPR